MSLAAQFSDEALIRLLVAVALGAVVGTEREVNDQPAGLRTHIAVCLGAALFGVVSTLGFDEFVAERATTNVNVDVTRVASQVVVGIGFLGAGVIFRQNESVHNLTTAASMWVTSAIGLTAGVGDLGTAAAATVVLLAVLVALRPLRRWLRRRFLSPTRELALRLRDDARIDDVLDALDALPGVERTNLRVTKVEGLSTLTLQVRSTPGSDLDAIVTPLAVRDDIVEFGLVTEVNE